MGGNRGGSRPPPEARVGAEIEKKKKEIKNEPIPTGPCSRCGSGSTRSRGSRLWGNEWGHDPHGGGGGRESKRAAGRKTFLFVSGLKRKRGSRLWGNEWGHDPHGRNGFVWFFFAARTRRGRTGRKGAGGRRLG